MPIPLGEFLDERRLAGTRHDSKAAVTPVHIRNATTRVTKAAYPRRKRAQSAVRFSPRLVAGKKAADLSSHPEGDSKPDSAG